MRHVTQFHEEWNCARTSNVAAKRILRECCRSQPVGAKRDWGKREFRNTQHRPGKNKKKGESKGDKCQVFRRRNDGEFCERRRFEPLLL